MIDQTLDNRTWIVSYTSPTVPLVYYRYDRDGQGGGAFTRLFVAGRCWKASRWRTCIRSN